MGSYLNPGNEAFAVALNSEIYVDKTGLLTYTNKVMNTLQGYICNSRPRRFGKSITANMLTAYYSKGCSSKEMFSGLEISRAKDFEKHLNQYDVLHWDIQWCMEPAGGPERIVSYISEKTISELKEYYPHILPEEIRSLPEALSRINAASGTKFIVIIDEWDVLIRDEAADLKTQEEYINFLRAMFKGTEPTKYIQLAYLTGILPVKKEKTQSALNNFKDYSMLHAGPIAPYVGFTETEVQKLCEVYGQRFEEVKRWYDGYQIGKYHVYNPNAVVNLMLEGEFQSYWSGTASYEAIVPLINMDFDGLKSAVIEMLSGDHVPVDVTSFQNDTVSFANKDDVLTYLIHLGYLAYDRTFRTAFIPNEEIRQELILATKRKKWNELIVFQKESEQLLKDTIQMNGNAVAKEIEKIKKKKRKYNKITPNRPTLGARHARTLYPSAGYATRPNRAAPWERPRGGTPSGFPVPLSHSCGKPLRPAGQPKAAGSPQRLPRHRSVLPDHWCGHALPTGCTERQHPAHSWRRHRWSARYQFQGRRRRGRFAMDRRIHQWRGVG